MRWSGARGTRNRKRARTWLRCRPRAVDKGDHYVINGQKIWTSQAHYADWILLLARTDPDAPKHRGISMFLADMKDPGVEVRPIINMTGSHEFNETFFNDLKVPKENVVGEVNRGWYAGMTLLDFERSGVEYAAYSRRVLDDTIEYARETSNGKSNGEAPDRATRRGETSFPKWPWKWKSPTCFRIR